MPAHRQLTFQDLNEILPEVERLLTGYTATGQWSLAQICHHLSTTIRLTSRPASNVPESTPEQNAIREAFFAAGVFPPGRQSPAPFIPPPALDAATEAQSLAESIKRFQAATGPYPAHPYLGQLDANQWHRFHAMHAAHHLGFVAPREDS